MHYKRADVEMWINVIMRNMTEFVCDMGEV